MEKDIIEKLLKETSLDTRLNVINEMMLIDFLTVMGYREDKMWSEDEDNQLIKLCDFAKKMTNTQMGEIKQWEDDVKSEKQKLLTVIDSEMINGRRDVIGGSWITFNSKENIIKDSYVKIIYNEKVHYYCVSQITIENDLLSISAYETGYWCHKFNKMNDFDPRSILGCDLELVNDTDEIKRIREMSSWC